MEHFKIHFNEYFTKKGAIREELQGAFQGAMRGQLHLCTNKRSSVLLRNSTNLFQIARCYTLQEYKRNGKNNINY